MSKLARALTAAVLVATALMAPPTGASAATTIGQLAPGSPPPPLCNTRSFDLLQPTVTSGPAYVVPATVPQWTVTSWSTNASAGAGQRYTMKVFRQVAGPTYTVVGHDGPRDLNPGALNTFATNLPVKAGDFLGFNDNDGSAVGNACDFTVPGESHLFHEGSLADGESSTFETNPFGFRLNVTAVVTPANSFTVGTVKRNKKKGTAILTVNVPNPGELTGSGKGVKVAGAAGVVTSKTVTAPGKVKLAIRAKGKKKTTLNETGKVKVKPKITYTPTGGDPSTQSIKVKLKKNL